VKRAFSEAPQSAPIVTSKVIATGDLLVHHCGHRGDHRANAAVHAAKERTMNRRDMLLSATLMAAGIAGSQLSSSAATAATNDEKKTPARNVNEAVVRYLAAWNERDASRRLELVAKAWTEDGTYLDRVRHGRGHNEIDAMIATAQAHFPGYQLHLASGIETHHDHVRFS
jgi:hypothetical protein